MNTSRKSFSDIFRNSSEIPLGFFFLKFPNFRLVFRGNVYLSWNRWSYAILLDGVIKHSSSNISSQIPSEIFSGTPSWISVRTLSRPLQETPTEIPSETYSEIPPGSRNSDKDFPEILSEISYAGELFRDFFLNDLWIFFSKTLEEFFSFTSSEIPPGTHSEFSPGLFSRNIRGLL